MASTNLPSVAFFGATGGCASSALALALKAGYRATALARNPQKLRDIVQKLDVPESAIASNLEIVQGSGQDLAAVKATLAPKNNPASLIIFGIGGTPKLVMNLRQPVTLDQPRICQESISTVLGAQRALIADGVVTSENKATILVISTTGISDKQRDVPCAFTPFYSYGLAVPHEDKKIMENLVVEGAKDGLIGDFVILRPSLLKNGAIQGLDKVQEGWELPGNGEKSKNEPGPAIGYTISRGDVGKWIFEKFVKGNGEWNGKCVSITT